MGMLDTMVLQSAVSDLSHVPCLNLLPAFQWYIDCVSVSLWACLQVLQSSRIRVYDFKLTTGVGMSVHSGLFCCVSSAIDCHPLGVQMSAGTGFTPAHPKHFVLLMSNIKLKQRF